MSIEMRARCELYVEEVPSDVESCRDLRVIARSWKETAIERKDAAEDEEKRALFLSSQKVNKVILQRSNQTEKFNRKFRSLVCYDQELTVRGFAVFKHVELPLEQLGDPCDKERKVYLHLSYLTTDPENLMGPARISGVGSLIVSYLRKKCIAERSAGIFIEPLPTARLFFERFGFIESRETGSQKYAMTWTPVDDSMQSIALT